MKARNEGVTSALYIWNGISLFWGTSFQTDPHVHNTLQLVFDIEKTFKLKDAHSDWKAYSAAIIREGHRHQLDSCGSIQLFIYLDADSFYARELSKKYLLDKNISSFKAVSLRKLNNKFFKELLVSSGCANLLAGCQTIFDQLISIKHIEAKDERVLKALDFISQSPNKQFRVKDVAEYVCLSESRLRHLFKEQVGQPIQNFILWMKVVDSLSMVLKGKQVAESAYDAGFWDSSHMNRAYKDLLGITPGKVKVFKKELRIVACKDSSLYTLRTEIFHQWNEQKPTKTIEILNQS